MTENRENYEEDEYFEDFEETEAEPKGRKKIVVKILSVFLLLGTISILVGIGIAIGILLTRSGFKDDQLRLENLQEEVTSLEEELATAGTSEEELEEALARAEEAEAKVEDLQETNDSLEERIENLKDGLAATASETPTQSGLEEEYINWKFWSDGNRYQATGDNVFHSDPECKNELENEDVVLISPVVSTDKIKDETGEIITVYTSLSESGFVYSREVPNINPV